MYPPLVKQLQLCASYLDVDSTHESTRRPLASRASGRRRHGGHSETLMTDGVRERLLRHALWSWLALSQS